MTGSASSSCPGARRWRRISAVRFAASWRRAAGSSGTSAASEGWGCESRRAIRPIIAPACPRVRSRWVRACAELSRWRSCGAMNPTKILWLQILVVCSTVLGFIWAATEWTAWQLAFQPELGPPWFSLFGLPVYLPPAFFWWWFGFDAYAHDIFVTGGFIAGAGGVAAFVVAVAMSVWRAREVKRATTYGSARWADEHEIRKAGLLHPDGVLLGRWHGAYLRHHGPEHVLCFAPTRSGKGVGLVVPTLLTWPGSAIVHDIKGENWTLTAGWRARFGRAVLFDPTNLKSSAYNPLLEVRRGAWEVRDVQNIADVLVDPEGALEKRNHWEKTSHALLVGTILHVLYAEPDKTLAGVANFLSDPKRPIEKTLRAMMTTPHLGAQGVHPVVASAARELLNKSENERSGVLSTAMSFLGLYRDPVVAAVTRRCDWRIRDLVEASHPVTLYLVVPPSDISRTKPLVRLILNQIGRRLTEELDSKRRRHRLLLMLDEFPALGHLMISRQETARPLLTAGEVMQLPPDDELVLVSGCAPIRAKKARYFEDPEMQARILRPPTLTRSTSPPIGADPLASHHGDWVGQVVEAPSQSATDDPANAGIRREPELPEHEEIVPEPKQPVHEFDPMDEEPDDEVQRQRIMQRTFGTVARQVSLDPSDDMQM